MPLTGVMPFAQSLDTLGLFTHSAEGMLSLWEALGFSPGQGEEAALGVPDPLPDLEPAMAQWFNQSISLLRDRGLSIEPIPMASWLDRLAQEARILQYYEGARVRKQRFRQYGDRLLDLASLVREGLQITDARYGEALAFIAESKQRIAKQFDSTPLILVPAATGPAPKGLASAGDARMNSPWTALGTPAISIPMRVGAALPLGIQLTAGHGQEARLLRAALRIERLLGAAG
jgi:Asp-tRNA(Asn)/Glu-tRNA(Gln) amidotransferase A subunit family amidase